MIDPIVQELTARRKELRVTQLVVANRIETTVSQVAKWERGVANPYLSSLTKWAKALGRELTLKDYYHG